jgi:hypothetical protein
MFAGGFGYWSFMAILYFSTKNYKNYKSRYMFLKYNQLLFKGSLDFLMKKKNDR